MARANYYITPITAILSPGRCIFCLPHFTVWQNKIRVGSSLTSLPLRFPTRSLTRLCSNSMNHITCYAADEAANSQKDAGKGEKPDDVVVQYVVLRRDLIETWPLGSVVTQGCHASVSAIWSNKEDPHTLQYCSPENIDSMHKVTLEVKGEAQILNLSEKLTAGGIAHKLWIEQPENIPTCLATKPYPKPVVSLFFKKLKLCK